ncbi:MAG: endonuclease/exonuclease/phosphatase family protein [Anaerolineae bacterium]|nr:endonuclease/exonuclease/phosphatase family protein [Anaerolineae bacterium]MDW8070223.1 endonuclease/exonuclease/phosphatase family protein [Anaerolineae bacterium]
MARRRRTGSSCLGRFLAAWSVVALWGFALALVLWNLARVYPGDRWLPVRVGNYFAPWLMVGASGALVIALLARRRWLWRAFLVLILIFVVRFWTVLLPRIGDNSAIANASSTSLRVMTFNVHYANEDVAGVTRLILAESPDLIAFQEFTHPFASRLITELAAVYPYTLLDHANWPRLGLISRYPLEALPTPPDAWRTQAARWMTPEGEALVWNVHSSPAIGQRGWERQRQTFRALAREVRAASAPVILLGDLNTTDQAQNYQLLAEHLTDVHRAVGWGLGFTFPGRWRDPALLPLHQVPLIPFLRIDYVFISQHWLPDEIHVVPEGPGSDHLPVVATLRRAL